MKDMETEQIRELVNDEVRSMFNEFTHEMLLFTQGHFQIENRLSIQSCDYN